MDQSFPLPEFPEDPPRTELQRRMDQGEQRRTILEELYRANQAGLYAVAYASLRDVGQAEDFVQEIFLKMHVSFDSMITHEPARSWIFKTARNQLVDWYRHRKRRDGGDVPVDFDDLERNMAAASRTNRFEEQLETWVGTLKPMLVYLRTIAAKGWLRDAHLIAYWGGTAEGLTQRELAERLGLTQGRISQMRSELKPKLGAALYLCQILGIVKAPIREAEIRSHLDLFEVATSLTAADRVLLLDAGSVVQLDPLGQPYLLPKDAEAAIQARAGGHVATLRELHDAESKYAAAIPNPSPHCIESPCALHTASGT
jgi:RNA polymerase sigma factor (sigma-70 family)